MLMEIPYGQRPLEEHLVSMDIPFSRLRTEDILLQDLPLVLALDLMMFI